MVVMVLHGGNDGVGDKIVECRICGERVIVCLLCGEHYRFTRQCKNTSKA